jgi:hypothetical protein
MFKSASVPILAGVALAALACTYPVHATIVETISTPNSALSGLAGPYAQVSITRVDNFTADIVFTSLTTNGITFLMGDGGTADLNVTGAYTLGAVTETGLPGFTPTFIGNSPARSTGLVSLILASIILTGMATPRTRSASKSPMQRGYGPPMRRYSPTMPMAQMRRSTPSPARLLARSPKGR